MRFTKMHGAGNDYIYIDCFEEQIEEDRIKELAIKASDRHKGIGGDGVVLVCPSNVADVKMRMFNADGSEGKMCGNAIRCVARLAYERAYVDSNFIRVETLSGIKSIMLNFNMGKLVGATVNMGKPCITASKVPFIADEEQAINYDFMGYKLTAVSMGNPHAVIFVPDVMNFDVQGVGSEIGKSPAFPEGVNVEFVEFVDRTHIKMRVWERGSGETLACGTGASASVVASVLNGMCDLDTDVKVSLLGGDLTINYNGDYVTMAGEAVTVFEGEYDFK